MEQIRSFFKKVFQTKFVQLLLAFGIITFTIACVFGMQAAMKEMRPELLLGLGIPAGILLFVWAVSLLWEGKLSRRHRIGLILGIILPAVLIFAGFLYFLFRWLYLRILLFPYR